MVQKINSPYILKSVIAFFLGTLVCLLGVRTADASPFQPSIIPSITSINSVQNKVTRKASPSQHMWNLQDADIISFINEVSRETGKNFIIDPRVSGKVTIVSSRALGPKEIYPVFLSTLQTLGYSAVPSGRVIKIVPIATGSQTAGPLADEMSPGISDQLVVRVIPLRNVTASQLVPILRPLMPQWSHISAYTPGNVLILSGRADNIKKLINIVNKVDVSSSKGIEIIPLEHASADQLVNVLSSLQNTSKDAGERSQLGLAADLRSNSILLSGNKSERLRMRVLISQLDAKVNGDKGNTEVIYLHYLKAKEFAPVLQKIAKNTADLQSSDEDANPKGKIKKKNPVNLTTIQPEPNTNALIITAPPALMLTLKRIINKLDIRPAQVLVEAIIVDIDQSDLSNFGIQWGRILSTAETAASAIASDGTSSASSVLNFQQGLIGIIPRGKLGAILQLLRTQKGSDILSTPSVVVLDNQKATIEVGKEVPEKTGEYATSSNTTTVTPFTTIQSKPVVLKLQVTPQISTGNTVRLKIDLKNDSLQNPEDPTLTPLTNTSKISNSVIINSNDILVLGGLISHDTKQSIEKVPILGRIPFIGRAFQHKIHNVTKKNLMVFIKPLILDDRQKNLRISTGKYNFIRNEQERWQNGKVPDLKDTTKQILPRLDGLAQIPQPF